jgi:hypothetical protein
VWVCVPGHVGRVEEFIVDVEVAGRHYLEERLPVEIDLIEGLIFLVVDVGVGEAAFRRRYPFEMIRPFEADCLSLLRFTPWMRIMSPHLRMF